MSHSGPLWHTINRDGCRALATIRSSSDSRALRKRWEEWLHIDSPFVVSLLDVAEADEGRSLLVIEYVEGQSLEVLMARGMLRKKEDRTKIVDGVRQGIEALHDKGLIHADITPTNVLVRPDGTPVIIDIIDGARGVRGTQSWSLDQPQDQDGDRSSWRKIAEWLGCADEHKGQCGQETISGSCKLPNHIVVGNTAIEEVLRRVAVSDLTQYEKVEMRHSYKRNRKKNRLERKAKKLENFLPIPPFIIRTFIGCIVVVSVIVFLFAFLPGMNAVQAGNQVSTGNCPEAKYEEESFGEKQSTGFRYECSSLEDTKSFLKVFLSKRDRALEQNDKQTIQDLFVGDAGKYDSSLIDMAQKENMKFIHLETELQSLDRLKCSDNKREVHFVAKIQQKGYSRCGKGVCEYIPDQPSHRVAIKMEVESHRIISMTEDSSL